MGVCHHLSLCLWLSLRQLFNLTNSADYKRLDAGARGGLWGGGAYPAEQTVCLTGIQAGSHIHGRHLDLQIVKNGQIDYEVVLL